MNTDGSVMLIDEWRTWQRAKGLSSRTVEDRALTVERMARWTGKDPQHIGSADIVEWLAEGGSWSRNTRWTYHTSLSAWFLWLQKLGYRSDNPMLIIDRPRRLKGKPHPISDDEMRRLLGSPIELRTRAMIVLAGFQGLRIHEIAKVRSEHFNLSAKTMTVTGKGGISAVLPMHPMVLDLAQQMPRRGFWFPGSDHGHQRRESVGGTIKEAMMRAGVSGSAHALRHWFGTALMEAGVDLRVIQILMRHQNLATTEIYTFVNDRRRAEGIDRLNPFAVNGLAA
jgi:site-specific recombinase XerD